MNRIKKLRNVIICEIVFAVLLFGAAEKNIGFRPFLLLLGLIQLSVVIYLILAVAVPIQKFAESLEFLTKEENTEEELNKIIENIPYMKQVKYLVDKFASQRTRQNSAKVFDKQTELTALQSQINPHFLYNTLETIRGQALMDDNYEIAKMVEALGAFFRYSISQKGNLVTLRDELANINNYMLIQRYRFNNRFSLEVIIDEEDEAAYDFLIPRLIIQPVIENAIFHGLEEKLEGGKVTIEVIVTDSNLIITISDNGKGISGHELKMLNERIQSPDMQLEEGNSNKQRNTGIALPNIHKRIQLLFGEEYGVNVYSTAGMGTDVEITIPTAYERSVNWQDEKGNVKS